MLATNAFTQSFYNVDSIQTISITFAQSNWDELLDTEAAGNDDYIMAQSVTINGIVFDSVGVKYKGNSTYKPSQIKNPFHIELDTYKKQDYDGLTDIKLSNVAKDPSFVREVLSYKILQNYMDAPLSNYSNVYVNGDLIGVYVSSESISKKFVKSRFGSKNNTFVKCNPPAGAGPGNFNYPNLVYVGKDSTLYYPKYELQSNQGWKNLVALCDTLNNNVANIEKILDVDRALWMLAFDNVFVNLDSYIGALAQNYYLYQDDFGRFLPIVWDLNESFGSFSATGTGNLNNTAAKQQLDPFLHINDQNYPLISQLLKNTTYKKMYLAHFKTLLQDNFTTNGSYYTDGLKLQTTVNDAVKADQNKFFTYADFVTNLKNDVALGGGPTGSTVPGITNLMNGRNSFMLGLNDFSASEPIISNIKVSEKAPYIGETFTITTNVLNQTSVVFRYRTAARAPFKKVVMYDDGLHNDGAANDNVFGAAVKMEAKFMEYYIYAENDIIGKFSPTNAEHAFYTLYSLAEPMGDIVINELLASNATIMADQNGEFDDWIEIYNKSNSPVNIENYTLTDTPGDYSFFSFPAGTIINPDEYIVVWADKNNNQSGYHAGFKLSADGETVYLTDATFNILDSISFGKQSTDISYGRYPNGIGNFQFMPPTFGAINMVNTTATQDFNSEKTPYLVYPNPAINSVTIEPNLLLSESKEIKVFDIYGKMMFTDKILNKLSINTSEWPSGLYFIKIGEFATKLIVE